MSDHKYEKFKLVHAHKHSGPYPVDIEYNLEEIYIMDEKGQKLSVCEFINSLTLAVRTMESRLEKLDGIQSKE